MELTFCIVELWINSAGCLLFRKAKEGGVEITVAFINAFCINTTLTDDTPADSKTASTDYLVINNIVHLRLFINSCTGTLKNRLLWHNQIVVLS